MNNLLYFIRMWWHFKVYRKLCQKKLDLQRLQKNQRTETVIKHEEMAHEEESIPLDPELIKWYQSKFSPSDSCEDAEETFMLMTNEERIKTSYGRLNSLLRRYGRYSAWTRNHFVIEDVYVLCVWRKELRSLGIEGGKNIPTNVKTCFP